jgi:hypothetical protein
MGLVIRGRGAYCCRPSNIRIMIGLDRLSPIAILRCVAYEISEEYSNVRE